MWRLMAATDIEAATGVFASSADHTEIGPSVRLGVAHIIQITSDSACREMARRAFGPFVDPRRIDADMDRWLDALQATWRGESWEPYGSILVDTACDDESQNPR